MIQTEQVKTLTLEKAKYYVTDPGYLFDAEAWQKFLVSFGDQPPLGTVPHPNGLVMHIFMTAMGDGVFLAIGSDGFTSEFGVDSGLFAIVNADETDTLLPDLAGTDSGWARAEVHIEGKIIEIEQGHLIGALHIETDLLKALQDAERETADALH